MLSDIAYRMKAEEKRQRERERERGIDPNSPRGTTQRLDIRHSKHRT